MGTRYVSTTGSDSADGLTLATAWRTWQFAVDQVVMGDVIEVAAGTYLENVVLNVDGAAGFPITIRKNAATVGSVILDGTGGQRALSMESRLYWNFEDFTVMNDGGRPTDTFVYGIFIGSQVPGMPNAQGCLELHFTRVAVTQVNRNARTDCLGVPVAVISYGDETAGGTASRQITFDFCSFFDCTAERLDHVVGTGFFAVSGNVRDLAWRDCTMSNLNGSDFISGVDTGGNVLPGAKPDRPRKLVFLRNTVSDIVGTGFYNQACHDTLVAQNVFIRNGFAVGANTEPQVSADYDILRRFWVRDNLYIDTVSSDVFAGAWIPTYDDVSDVWFTNNTGWRSADTADYPVLMLGGNQSVPGKFGVIGDSAYRNNITVAPSELMQSTLPAASTMQLDYNLWGSDGAAPFIWLSGAPGAFPYNASQDQHGNFQSYGTSTFRGPLGDADGYHILASSWAHGHGGTHEPSWYTPGLFGVYDPLVERDVYGDLYSPGHVDVGADQIMSKPLESDVLRTTLTTDVTKFNDLRYVAADPRVGGLAGQIGDLVFYENAPIRMLLQKMGSANTAWQSLSRRPTALDMLTAADLQSLFRVITGQPALAASVSHLWQASMATNLDQVNNLIGVGDFQRTAGTAALIESGLGGAITGARAMQTLRSATSTWQLSSTAACDVAAGAFALGGFMYADAEGGGSYWLSKRGDTGNKPGYSLSIDAAGTLAFTVVDTTGAALSTAASTRNSARSVRPFIAGRSITNNIISLCTDLERLTAASAAIGSLTNAFPLAMDLRIFGLVDAGMTGWINHLWFASGADAEAILGQDTVLCNHFTGLLAN